MVGRRATSSSFQWGPSRNAAQQITNPFLWLSKIQEIICTEYNFVATAHLLIALEIIQDQLMFNKQINMNLLT